MINHLHIVLEQGEKNVHGGIDSGYALNKLYELTNLFPELHN